MKAPTFRVAVTPVKPSPDNKAVQALCARRDSANAYIFAELEGAPDGTTAELFMVQEVSVATFTVRGGKIVQS